MEALNMVGTQRSPSDLLHLFRTAMRGVAASVVIVATQTDRFRHGMTATAFTSVSFDPLSVLVCINNRGLFHSAIEASKSFSVSLLGCDDVEVSRAFGSPTASEERFAVGSWGERHNLPYLTTAQANLFCQSRLSVPYGTHSILVGEVIDGHCGDSQQPLLYMKGEYGLYRGLAAGTVP